MKYLYKNGEGNINWVGGLVTLVCTSCKKNYEVKPYRKDKSKYCSFKCHGKKLVGHVPWNKNLKGIHLSPRTEFKQGIIPANFKGDDVGYRTLHHWVVYHKGQPDTCEFCGKSGLSGRDIHWANKSHEYKRELDDWIRLCRQCHKGYDLGRRDRKWLTI